MRINLALDESYVLFGRLEKGLNEVMVNQCTRTLSDPLAIVTVRPILGPTYQPSDYRVQVNVSAQVDDVLVRVNVDTLETPFKERATAPLLFVVGLSVGKEQTLDEG